jgi:hypothetical protein
MQQRRTRILDEGKPVFENTKNAILAAFCSVKYFDDKE